MEKEEISKILTEAEKLHPYKEIGNRDSYCDYNQGWSDAVDYIASMLGVEY